MSKISGVLFVASILVFASAARADDAAPPAAAAPVLVPAPAPAPVAQPMPPTPSNVRRTMAAVPADCTTCQRRAPCGREACFDRRDDCGWRLDGCGNRIGCLEVALEGAYSFMSNPDGNLGELVAGNTAPLKWNEVDYGGEFGGRATVAYRFAPFHRAEFRGAYYGDLTDSRTDSGFFGATPGATGTGDLSRPVNATFDVDSTTWGVEFNMWNEVSCEGRWRTERGLGVRYLSFDETARVSFVSTGPGAFPVANGFVDSDVTNEWYGIQACWMVHYDASPDLEFNATLKGLLGNVDRRVDVTDSSIFAGGAHSASAKNSEITWGAELELGARWRVTPRISVTAAANVFVLDNVQRAEDAMDFSHSNTGAVQAKDAPDQLVIESLFLGISITF